MNYRFIIMIFFLQSSFLCFAQDIVTINKDNFNRNGALSLLNIDGWRFTQKSVPDWYTPDLDTYNWEKLNPNDLSFEYTDQNGLVEGWFRLQFKVDSSLWGQDFYINFMPSGAAKMYINGNLYDAAGNPDKDPDIDIASIYYFARIQSGWLPKSITFDSRLYTIAVYCTDHDRYFLEKFSFRSMKAGFNATLFKRSFLLNHITMLSEYNFFRGIWLCGILLLSFLFGILLLLNRNESDLLWIFMLTFFLACSAIIEFLFSSYARGVWVDVGDLLYYECLAIAVGLIPITLSRIILNKVNKKLFKVLIAISALYPIVWYFSGSPFMDSVTYYLMGAALLTIMIICFIMIVSNRKKLGEAEWSVVWGLIVLVLWMLVHTIFINIGFISNTYRLATVATIYLTMPLSLLVYISIRFSDNIFRLRKNLDEINQLNNEKLRVQEEKQKLILSQKELLEKTVSERTAELRIKNDELSESNIQVQKQRDEILSSKNELQKTLTNLKATQAQLIHSEKMASLGELTAGIAHEIKNPLNFVNNFSEVSNELVDEIKELLEKENNREVLEIAEDLKQNLKKINQHGKRADSIVKGMLLHSRGTSGEKTLTDINDLLDQYVNLAYHGMRAQDKEFNINIEKDYDESLEKINVVPQDISRVFLNIINNASYAAFDKKKKSNDDNFSPTIKVSTKKLNDDIEIRIADNGDGIPSDILDKIFQPFFTTKPTGEGTGLGLSLSYDIVTKVHGGELRVETNVGEGTKFLILLPS